MSTTSPIPESKELVFNLSRLFPEYSGNTAVANAPKAILREHFEAVTAAVQLLYITESRIPMFRDILDRTGLRSDDVERILKHESFRDRMLSRGIHWPVTWHKESEDGLGYRAQLTPQQVLAMQIILDPSNHRNMQGKLKQAGVTYATWQNWLREPVFAEAVRFTSEQMLGDNVAAVHAKLINKAEGGDTQAMKLFYEVSGRHDPSRQQTQDLMRMVGLLLEVITRHVTDTSTLMRIQKDFDVVMGGGSIKPLDTVPANYEPDGDFFEFTPDSKE